MISIYNKISDYIMVLNSVGDIIFCNESFLNKLNYEYNEILNLNITKIIKNKYNHSASDIIKECKEINETIEFYTKSGQTIKINSNISIENFNNEKSILIIGKEVDSKAYTTEMLEDLLDNIDSCTFILKEDGKYLYVNKAFTNILNKTREEIIGTYNEEYWEYDIYTELDRNNKEVVRNKSPKIFNEKLVEGENIQWYESYKAPIFDKSGNHKYVVATSKNVTLSKTISEELYKNYNKTNLENRFYIGNKEDIDLKKKLTNIGEQILEYTQANSMSVLLYDREKNVLVPTIKLRDANKHFKNIERVPFPIKEEELANYKCCLNSVFPLEEIEKFSSINLNHCEEVAYGGNYLIELYNEFIGFICISFKKGNAPKFNSDEYMKYICNKIAMIIKNT
ncbi:MAG: PAS domain-containing protein, partial [Peptostreptococcaceae bacterium]